MSAMAALRPVVVKVVAARLLSLIPEPRVIEPLVTVTPTVTPVPLTVQLERATLPVGIVTATLPVGAVPVSATLRLARESVMVTALAAPAPDWVIEVRPVMGFAPAAIVVGAELTKVRLLAILGVTVPVMLAGAAVVPI